MELPFLWIFDADLAPRYRKDFGKEILFLSNMVALVGGGEDPQFDLCKVIMWDQHTQSAAAELKYKSTVLDVRLTDTHVVVALTDEKIAVYRLSDLHFLFFVENVAPMANIAVSLGERRLLACPSTTLGNICLRSLPRAEDPDNVDDYLTAFPNGFSMLALNYDGTLLAVSNKEGCDVLLFSTTKKHVLKHLRRGLRTEVAWSLSFSRDDNLLAFLTSSGTLHFFNIYSRDAKDANTIISSTAKLYLNDLAQLDRTLQPDIVCYCHFNRTLSTGQVIAMASNGKLLVFDFDAGENGNLQANFHPSQNIFLQNF